MKFIFALRSLTRHKYVLLINLLGLTVGIASCLLLLLFVKHEMDYDKQHKDGNRIFRITTEIKTGGDKQHLAMSPKRLNSILKNNYAEIEEAAYVCELTDGYHIKTGDKHFYQEGIREASPELFSMFSYSVILGNPAMALADPHSIVLTESLCNKLFGTTDVLNKYLYLNNDKHRITGVIQDIPKNSDLQFTALISNPYDGQEELLDVDGFNYVRTNSGSLESIEHILTEVEQKFYKPLYTGDFEGLELKFHAQPLQTIHFSDKLIADSPKGNKKLLIVLSIIAFLILGIACINYINLSLARSSQQFHSIGISKIIGAKRREVLYRFLSESAIVTFIALCLGIGMTELLLPVLNSLTGKDVSIHLLVQPEIFIPVIGMTIFIICIAGVIPAVYIYRFRALSLVTNFAGIKPANRLQSPLVILQFMVSIILIINLLQFKKQLAFMRDKDLGFDKKKIVAIEIPAYDSNSASKTKLLQQELLNSAVVEDVAYGNGGSLMGDWYSGAKMIFADEVNGRIKQFIIHFMEVDAHYLDLLGIDMFAGRGFDENKQDSKYNNVIVNEAYIEMMELAEPLNNDCPHNADNKIIGVVRDFHFASLHHTIEPLCIQLSNKNPDYLFVKTQPGNIQKINESWKNHFKGHTFSYTFLDDNFQKKYVADNRMANIVEFFTFISIFITCFGLSGLILFESQRRTKEIGIRKVNGAKISEILKLLNEKLIKRVVFAFIIACPVAWYIISGWLENFAYKSVITWWVFLLGGLSVLTIALIIVSIQSYKAAVKNPVESLRYE